MNGYYTIFTGASGQYYFNLRAGNHEIILASEAYESEAGARNGIHSAQVNSPLEERYERLNSSNGKFYFSLKAANHQVIGTSEMYESAVGRDNGIRSVQENGPTTDIREK